MVYILSLNNWVGRTIDDALPKISEWHSTAVISKNLGRLNTTENTSADAMTDFTTVLLLILLI